MDLQESTELKGGSGRYRADLEPSWGGLAGAPAGGYLAALALRAAGRESGLPRPVSIHCHFLQVPRSGAEVQLEVQTLRATKRTAALRVTMAQAGQPMLEALAWTAADELPGYDFAAHAPAHAARPEDWQSIEGRTVQPLPDCMQYIETRWDHADPATPGAHAEPYTHAWHRFRPRDVYGDAFVDAARLVVLADLRAFGPVAYYANVAPSQVPYFAPNMDLTVQFCRPSGQSRWLFGAARALAAAQGTIATRIDLWSESGEPLALASSTLFCRPNPFRS